MVSNPVQFAYNRYTNLGILVEGLGTVNGQYRLVSGPRPSWDSNSLYQDCLVSWPDSFSASVDFQAGTAEIQSVDFMLRRTSLLLAALWSPNPLVIAEATAAATASTTTINTNNTGLAGQVIYWEREAILLGSHAGGGQYTGCTRGHLGTNARRHGTHDDWDRELFSVYPPSSLKGRIVKLFLLPSGSTGTGSEVVLWTGILDEVTLGADLTITIEARSLLALVDNARLMTVQRRWAPYGWSYSTARPDGGYGNDGDTTRKALVCSASDKRVARVQWLGTTVSGVGRYYLATGTAEAVAGLPLPEDIRFAEEYYEVISTVDAQPANSASPGDTDLPLSRNPATLLLQLLTTTPNNGIAGVNGSYDLGLDNLAGDLDDSLVDVAAIVQWGKSQNGAQVDNLWLGLDGEPENLTDVVRRILQPLGAVLFCNAAGLLSVASYRGTGGLSESLSIAQNSIISVGHEQRRGAREAISTVIVEYGMRPGQEVTTVTAVDGRKNRRLPPGDRSTANIEAHYYSGVGRPSVRGLAITAASASRVPAPEVTIRVTRDVSPDPGDPVLVTHSALVKGGGAVGWTDEPCVVLSNTLVWEAPDRVDGGIGTVYRELRLANTGALYNTRLGLIGPSAKVTAWNPGLKRLTVAANEFVSSDNEWLDKDVEGFVATDTIQIVDQYGTVEEALAEIASVNTGSNYIFLVNSPSHTPVAGDIVRLAPWDDATTLERSKWCFISDDGNTLGSATANAYSYTE
jgi:hypothetical protein